MITSWIRELIIYGLRTGLISPADECYVTNQLLDLFDRTDYPSVEDINSHRPLHEILALLTDYAVRQGLISDATVAGRDLFDTRIMGLLTPPPSVVREAFQKAYLQSPKTATDYYYRFCQDTNYIRMDRIVKDEKWVTETPYGPIDITINLSKPEKDPRDIAKAATSKKSEYPKCLLCRENEGYAGHAGHPARQNHRLIPVCLEQESYFLQYSPYVYYNEHCIILNEKHIPMKIDRQAFLKLLDFVRQFPHYMAGSNADLPIVGGSILSHDHFQGGGYTFAMAKAPNETEFSMNRFPDIHAGTVKWPMSVIRLNGEDRKEMAEASSYILDKWRCYTDAEAFIFSETEGILHNTITPIARKRGKSYELDLVLRNNITTDECPWGVFHPSADLHHIKKENIGLIEVMGLAILPSRLKEEMKLLEDAILSGNDLRRDERTAKHADWAQSWVCRYDSLSSGNIHGIVQKEIGLVFTKVLECAGVYKRTQKGQEFFSRFIESL